MKSRTPKESTQTPSKRPNWKRRLIRASALTAAIVVGTTTMLLSLSPAARAFAMHSGGDEQGSFFERMHGGAHSQAQMHAHFDKVLTEAGASDAQKQQIHTIMKSAMTDEHADLQRFHATFDQLKTLLTASSIDDAAIANVRAEQDRLMLATSHRMSDTAVAVARVLTPQQREKLGAEIDKMMASHSAHHHM